MDTDTIITGDCLDILTTTPPSTVQLAFGDPPFNIGVNYPGYHDRRQPGDYLAFLEERFHALRRVLSPVGSLVVASGPEYQAEVCVMLKGLGLAWRNTVVWHYTFGQSQKKKFTPSWTALHYFVANPKRITFNRDDIRVTSTRQILGDERADEDGKTPDDVWFLRPQDAEAEGFFDPAGDVWHVRREHGRCKGREDHPVQMALPVMERIVRALSNPGDLVLDPFAGTGTTLVAAKRLGRRYLGIELGEETAALARRRLQETAGMPVRTRRAEEFPRPSATAEDAEAPLAPEDGMLF
jgi:site-specific DNA-methyltransferase (adenine-specific)